MEWVEKCLGSLGMLVLLLATLVCCGGRAGLAFQSLNGFPKTAYDHAASRYHADRETARAWTTVHMCGWNVSQGDASVRPTSFQSELTLSQILAEAIHNNVKGEEVNRWFSSSMRSLYLYVGTRKAAAWFQKHSGAISPDEFNSETCKLDSLLTMRKTALLTRRDYKMRQVQAELKVILAR